MAGTALVRVFRPQPYGVTALTFREFGPLARFDHHRHPPRRPAADPGRGVLYAAPTLSCCVVEVFGDGGQIEPAGWYVARLLATRDLRLLDLRGAGAMRAGSVTALSQAPDHSLAQSWSRHFYETPAYGACDGLLYHGAHNGEEAVALYERAGGSLACPTSAVLPLDSPALRPALLLIADAHGLDTAP